MATFTLQGTYDFVDGVGSPGKVCIDIASPAGNRILDSAGNVVFTGPRNVALDAAGHFSVTLFTDVTTGASTTIGYRLTARLDHNNLAPVEFWAKASGSTWDIADIDTQVVTPLTPNAVTTTGLDAQVASLVPTTSGSQTAAALSATYGGRVHVTAYGAKGDGATDDTAAIHAARDAAAANGADLYFPPGVYLTTGLTANKAGQRWTLDKAATLKAKTGATASVVVVSVAGVTIAGGTIDGNRANVASSAAGVYSSTHTDDLTVEDVTVAHTAGYGVELSGNRVRVRRCRFSDIAATAVLLIPLSAATADCEISGNHIDKSTEAVSTGYGAISVSGTTSYTNNRPRVTNNHVHMPASPTNGTGLAICIEVRAFCPGAVVSANTTTGGAMGVSIDRSNGSTITGNTINGPNWYGVELAGSADCVVSGNTIDGNGVLGGGAAGSSATAAIVTDGASPSDRATITGNTVRGMVTGGGSSCVNLTSGSGFVVVGNHLDGSGGAHGVVFASVSGGTVSGNRIAGPSFAGSTAVMLSNSVGRVAVSGNHLFGFDRGVSLKPNSVTTDNVTITGNVFQSVTTADHRAATGTGAIGSAVRYGVNIGAADV